MSLEFQITLAVFLSGLTIASITLIILLLYRYIRRMISSFTLIGKVIDKDSFSYNYGVSTAGLQSSVLLYRVTVKTDNDEIFKYILSYNNYCEVQVGVVYKLFISANEIEDYEVYNLEE
jgi:hypothetical protein